MYKQFSYGSKHFIFLAWSLKISASRRTVIKAKFYGILSKTTFFSVSKTSFSLDECPFMRIEDQ